MVVSYKLNLETDKTVNYKSTKVSILLKLLGMLITNMYSQLLI